MLTGAFHHLQSAIQLLDAAEAPGHIACHVDLAARQVEELIAGGKAKLTPTAADGASPAALPS